MGADGATPVEVRRSTRRRRTVSAYRSEGRIVVLVPARMSRAEERLWVERMVAKLERQSDRRRQASGDAALEERARKLAAQWLEGRPRPASVRWSSVQRRRWGSCTVDTREIRLSSRLQRFPSYVGDYVLVHELAHLLEAAHGPAFWAWVARYPQAERARGFLEGVEHGDRAGADADDNPGAYDEPNGEEPPSGDEPQEPCVYSEHDHHAPLPRGAHRTGLGGGFPAGADSPQLPLFDGGLAEISPVEISPVEISPVEISPVE